TVSIGATLPPAGIATERVDTYVCGALIWNVPWKVAMLTPERSCTSGRSVGRRVGMAGSSPRMTSKPLPALPETSWPLLRARVCQPGPVREQSDAVKVAKLMARSNVTRTLETLVGLGPIGTALTICAGEADGGGAKIGTVNVPVNVAMLTPERSCTSG